MSKDLAKEIAKSLKESMPQRLSKHTTSALFVILIGNLLILRLMKLIRTK